MTFRTCLLLRTEVMVMMMGDENGNPVDRMLWNAKETCYQVVDDPIPTGDRTVALYFADHNNGRGTHRGSVSRFCEAVANR